MRVFHNYNAYNSHEKHCTGMAKSKQLIASCKDDNIDPYFSGNPNVKYLTYTDQIDKFKPTEYYIVYDFETLEEPLNNNDENIMIEREDDDSSSSSLSQPSSSSSSPIKGTTKISHIVLLSAAWLPKPKVESKQHTLIVEMVMISLLNDLNL
jgi:hypothetical protein